MEKPKLIIVEAPQGGGKTTLTNSLRDGITSTMLLRFAGTPTPNKENSYEYHKCYLEAIKTLGYVGLNHILDRSYISEQVFASLGFKDYNFEDYAKELTELVCSMQDLYDIHFILLEATEEVYVKRLKRDKPQYSTAKFSGENSVKQLNSYRECFKLIPSSENVHVHYIDTSNKSRKATFNEVLKLTGTNK